MPALIVLGNTNQYTFANSINIANQKSKAIFGNYLTDIFVFNSKEADAELTKQTEWVDHLNSFGIPQKHFVNRIMEISSSKESIEEFGNYIEIILRGLNDSSQVIVDLTNSVTLQKNLLSIVSYILEIKHQYLIDRAALRQPALHLGLKPADIGFVQAVAGRRALDFAADQPGFAQHLEMLADG